MMAGHTRAAELELRQANRYHKGARKRACWLTLILVIILTVVLLAVSLAIALLTIGVNLSGALWRCVIWRCIQSVYYLVCLS